jgi:zinc/manganese transport system ATP-binding protein
MSPQAESSIITAKDLAAGYRGKTVWKDVNFSIKPGEFIGLLGPNGAGKTTLFRLLLGLSQPTSGKLTVLSKTPSKGNPKIGYIPQRRVIDSETRIEALEYVRLSESGSRLGFSWPSQAKRERQEALKALKKVDGLKLAHRPLSELSGGELQRIWLAQALAGRPDILLLDEPLASLDIRREVQLIRLINQVVREQGITVLLIAHDINPLLPVVDRILYIANSKVLSGKPEEVVTSKTLSALYEVPIEVLRSSSGQLAVLGLEGQVHHDA